MVGKLICTVGNTVGVSNSTGLEAFKAAFTKQVEVGPNAEMDPPNPVAIAALTVVVLLVQTITASFVFIGTFHD